MPYIRLPNNSYFPIAEGESPQDAMNAAREKYPKAFMSEGEIEQKQGFAPAFGEAWKGFKGSALTGLGEMTGSETAKNWARQAQEEAAKDQAQGKQGFIPTEEEDVKKAWDKGLMSGIGASARKYVTEPLGGIAGRYVAPVAAGAAATGLAALAAPEAVASGVGLLGAGLLGKGVTSLADLPAEVGENIQRQRETGKEVDATSATAYGLVQAALAGFGIPGLGKLAAPVQKVFSNEANVLAKKVLEGMPKEQALAQLNGTLKNIVLGSGEAAVTGAGLMVGTEAARRAAAGQGVTDEEAMKEYGEQLKGAAEMAPLFGVMHGVGVRGREKKVVGEASKQYEAKKGVEDRARVDAEAAALAEEQQAQEFKEKQAATMGPAENAAEGIQGRTADIFGEQNRTEGPAKGKQAFGKMEGDVSPFEPSLEAQQKAGRLVDKGISDNAQIQQLEQQLEEIRRAQAQGTTFKPIEIIDFEGNKQTLTDPGALRGREASIERQIEALKQPTTQELTRQRNLLKTHVSTLQDQVAAAAEKGDVNAITSLSPQLQAAQKALTESHELVKKATPIEQAPEVQLAELKGKLAAKTKELQKAGGAQGDFDKIHKLAGELKEIQEKIKAIPEQAPDLLAQAEASRIKGEAEAKEALAQQQQDMFAQVGKPESRAEAGQRQLLDRYQESLKQLEDAHAENADKRIIDELVEKVREAAAEKAAAYAKTSETPNVAKQEANQVRIERIKRAIAEAEANGDTASVAGLRNQLAKAIVESATPDAPSRRSRALENQQAAIEEIRSQVEDLKSGRFLGEGTRDPATAASMRQGLEQKANESIGRYVEATIREVNAVREQNGTKRLTNPEAIRLAMDVRGHLENAVRNLNEPALRMPKEGTVSTLEKQLAQIKKKHHKGPAIKKARGPEILKTEVQPRASEAALKLGPLYEKGGARRPENKDLLERVGGKPFETEARKAERLAEEKAEAERVERSGVNPDQKSWFGEKELEPVATTRATPENFQRMLTSREADRARKREAKQQAIEKTTAAAEAKKTEEQKKKEEGIATRRKTVEADIAAKQERIAEAKKAERMEGLSKVKQEVIETKFKAPGQADRVLRKKITREERTPEEKQADKLAAEREQQKQLAERREPARQRQKLGEALKQESELNKQLKALQAEQGKLFKAKESIEKALATAKTEKNKKHWQARLEETRTAIDAADFANREKSLKTQLEELAKVGVKVERVLEVAGNRPGRENKGAPLRTGKTVADKYNLKDLFKEVEKEGEIKFTDTFGGDEVAEFRGRSGNDYRAQAPHTGERLDPKVSKAVSDAVEKNAPKDVVLKSVENFEELPEKVKAQLVRDGFVEGGENTRTIRGFVTPEGEVYVIRGNHKSIKDMETTYVHELVGHAGVDRLIGEKGMTELTKRVEAHGGAMELAKKLGVDEDVQGALNDFALGIQEMTNRGASKEKIDKALKDMETQAVRELIAYTVEKRVDENFKQKAGRWLQEIVGAVRQWLRDSGLAELSKVSTSDIYNILRQSQRNYNKGELGAFRESNGQVAFRNKTVYADGFDTGLQEAASKIYLKEKSAYDRIKAGTSGMSMMTRFIDRFAPLEYIARNMADKLEGVQMMYYNRLFDQRNNMMGEIATHGSVGLFKNEDGTHRYKSRGGPSLKDVFETAAKAKDRVGDGAATTQQFGLYLAAERAASDKGGLASGLAKLSLDGKLSVADAKRILDFGRGDKNFQEARKQYREYNNGMLDLMVESGRLSKADAAVMKQGDYVPYYRERNGEIIDTEHNIKVGDLKTQAYLKELIGGDSAIVNFETGALQNTYMLTDMAMGNIATKNTAYTLQKLGLAEIRPGDGKASPNAIRFYENGVQKHAVLETSGGYTKMEAQLDKMREAGKANTPEYKKLRERAEASRASESFFGDIPAELIVKGMEGVATSTPLAVSMMRGPANLLRKAVTRNPAYAARVAFKDSLSGWITSGADVKPIVGALANLKKSWEGQSPEVRTLQEQGIIGGHVFAGTMSDMRTVAQHIAQGKTGWEKLWAKADRMAIIADESARLTLYNGFIKKGMSPMEATLATLESQNFTKHGFSPSMKMLSTMIPFFNAQVQGLNTFARGMTGKSLFEDKLGVKARFLARGAILAGTTMLYSALMQDNETYKNATDYEKLNYWFIPIPGMKDPIRVPIPFEAGTIFKALPEAIYNMMTTDAQAKDVLPALKQIMLSSVPGYSNLGVPQAVKPVLEAVTNTNFMTLDPIEGERQRAELRGHRATASTSELAKAIGEATTLSPMKIDHVINGYTGAVGTALMSMFNPLLQETGAPETPTSKLPIIGGFTQPTDGAGLINKGYESALAIEQINTTYKRMLEENPEKADRFLEKNMNQIDQASAAGKFRKEMGDRNKYERQIRADTKMTAADKRKALDEIRQIKIEIAKEFNASVRE
jgi:hypothetical protein